MKKASRAKRFEHQLAPHLEQIRDGLMFLNSDWTIRYVNRAGAAMLRRLPGELLGKNALTEFPESLDLAFFREAQKAMNERIESHVEAYYPPLTSWFECSYYPADDGITCVYRETTEYHQALEAEKGARTEAQLLLEQVRRQQSELELANEELRAANEELEAANEEFALANEELRQHQEELQALRHETDAVYRIGQTLSAELNLKGLVQAITDAATTLAEAEFGAFFYRSDVKDLSSPADENLSTSSEVGAEEGLILYTLSGAPDEAFEKFPMPRNTLIFGPTFTGSGIVRLEDVTQDPRYGKNPPYNGMPEGHLPVRSYMAVPVISRSGQVLGGLFFGHPRPGIFKVGHERMVAGLASQAAIALDNARLYKAAVDAESELREKAEQLRNQRQWLEEALNRLPAPVLFVEQPSGRVTFANHAADELAGGRFPRNVPMEEYESVYSCTDSAGNPIPRDQFPSALAARGERVDGFEMQWRRANGKRTLLAYADFLPAMFGHEALSVVALQDITHLKEIENELRRVNQTKDEFLAMLAHELRNPLAPMRTAIEILQRKPGDEAVAQRNREIIARQVEHMARLTDDLLDVSRVTRRSIALRIEPLDMVALVREVAQDYQNSLEITGIGLSLSLPESPVWVCGDSTRLLQAVGNLMNNAIKFTERGGVISVSMELSATGDAVTLSVADTGVGISPDMLPYIWDPFTQADRSLERSRGGLGLGLALVRGLVQLHGGTVSAESQGPGKGSRFSITIPTVPEPAQSALESELSEGADSALRVLVVEDNQDAANSLRDLLELFGHQVEISFEGSAALRIARSFRPQVVLCDIGLPGLDGYAVAGELRRIFPGAAMRLIAISGYGQTDDRRRSQQAGFDHHLVKPVDPELLRSILSGYIAAAHESCDPPKN